MSYVIGNLVYGIPWNKKLDNLSKKIEKVGKKHKYFKFLDEKEDYSVFIGFQTLYSAGASITVGYLGHRFFTFTEINNIKLSKLNSYKITSNIKFDVFNKLKILPSDIKKLCEKPDLYIIWSSA